MPTIAGSRMLVAGATGVLGGAMTRALHAAGAHVAVAGRDSDRLAERAAEADDAPSFPIEGYDLDGCAGLAKAASAALGGLDGVVVAVGVAAFGETSATPDHVAEHLVTVNALAPRSILRGSLGELSQPGALCAFTGVVAERPQPGMVDYSASKATLARWLDGLRRELRSAEVTVLDVQAPHIDTGLAERAVHGSPPRLPRGANLDEVVDTVVSGLEQGSSLARPGGKNAALTLE